MANVDRVNGFMPVSNIITGSYNGQSTEYAINSTYATNLFVGDAVKIVAGGANADGIPYIEQAAAGAVIVGVIVGFKVERDVAGSEHPGYSAASTASVAYVCDDPNVIFIAQGDGVQAPTTVGELFDHVVAAGSTVTGASGMELDSSTNLTASGQWRVLSASRRVDNQPALTNAKWHCMIAEHARTAFKAGT